jgi:hypothetical protein
MYGFTGRVHDVSEKLTFGVADTIDVADGDWGGCALEGVRQYGEGPFLVVDCGVSGEETLAGRGDVCVADIREDVGGPVRAVEDDADAELVCGALEADRDVRPVCRGSAGRWGRMARPGQTRLS